MKKLCLMLGMIGVCSYCIFYPEVFDSRGETENRKSIGTPMHKYLSARLSPTDRLGNHIFELTTLFSLAHKLGRIPVIWNSDKNHEKMINDTKAILPGLIEKLLIVNGTIPKEARLVEFHTKSRTYDDPRKLMNISDVYLHLQGNYYQSWRYFPNRRKELLGYLKSDGNFGGLPISDSLSSITCIHTRRGDFKFHQFYMSDPQFIREGEEYLRDKKKPRTLWKVILFGDDQDFMRSISENTTVPHFISSNSAPDDLIYSSQHCDNVLITAPGSTFGWWMGYFSKGNDVYYLDIRNHNDRVYNEGRMNLTDFFPPHWKMLRFENGTVEEGTL